MARCSHAGNALSWMLLILAVVLVSLLVLTCCMKHETDSEIRMAFQDSTRGALHASRPSRASTTGPNHVTLLICPAPVNAVPNGTSGVFRYKFGCHQPILPFSLQDLLNTQLMVVAVLGIKSSTVHQKQYQKGDSTQSGEDRGLRAISS